MFRVGAYALESTDIVARERRSPRDRFSLAVFVDERARAIGRRAIS